MADIEKVGVVGCGLMGSGIAQVCAQAGYETTVREIAEQPLEKGLSSIEKNLDRAVQKEKIDESEKDEILGRLEGTLELDDLADCDLVIEAVIEDIEVKEEVFGKLDEVCGPDTIFASNTSSLTITEMAASTDRPDRFVGLHFFNPVPVMKLVEVVAQGATADEAFDAAYAFAESLGKEPVTCRDNSGFIVNRLLVPYMMDAIRAYEEGIGSIRDIDKAMELGTGYPMGPFTLADFVGLETLLKIGDIMFDEYREKRYAPPPLLRRMVTAGHYGRKSGQGFYDYSGEEPEVADFVLR